jgi:hypothetical protein
MNEIMSRTDQICLDADGQRAAFNPNNQQPINVYSDMTNFQIKQEDVKPQFQQTYYQELKAVRDIDQQMHNPLLRNKQLSQQSQFQPAPPTGQINYDFGCNRMVNEPNWRINNNQQMNRFVQQPEFQNQRFVSESPNMMAQQFVQASPNQPLPKDLENLNTFVPPECDLNGIDEIIRQELSTSDDLEFGF